MVHKVRTRVRFKDGSEEVRLWDDDGWFFPSVLSKAVLLAEHDRGEDHDGRGRSTVRQAGNNPG